MPRTARTLVSLAVGCLVVLGGACGSDEAAEDTTTTTPTTAEATTSTTEPNEPTTSTATAGSTDLEGSWVADAADILAANTANVGEAGGLSCTGEIRMTFAGGRLDRTGDVTCGVPGSPITADGTISTTGTYTVDGDTLTITDTESGGRAVLAGREIPTPDSWGDGVATFRIDGDVLTIDFTDTAVGAVSQTYRRSG